MSNSSKFVVGKAARTVRGMNKIQLALTLFIGIALFAAQLSLAQRDEDDFDDSSFDDNGYNQPNRDADGSSNSQNYQPSSSNDDLDDDDDVDETHVSPQVAQDAAYAAAASADGTQNQNEAASGQEYEPAAAPMHQQQHLQQQQQQQPAIQYQPQQQQHYGQPQQQVYYANVAPQRFYSPPNSVLLANMDPNSYAAQQHQRYRRSTREGDIEDMDSATTGKSSKTLLSRQKRSHKYIGPVYTYVKTDKHARYKWGVKHKVGKHHG